MGAASEAEAIGAIEEVSLVNGAHDLGHRALDDLVFQRQDAERSLSTIGLRGAQPALFADAWLTSPPDLLYSERSLTARIP